MPYPARAAYLLCVTLLGCEEAPRPWSAPPSSRRVEDAGPFLPERGEPSLLGDAGFLDGADDAAPDDDADEATLPPRRLPGGLWARCHQGFTPTGEPGVDVTRLAVACGPANGMRRARGLLRGDAHPDRLVLIDLPPEEGRCLRIFAAADPPAGRLTLTARGPDGRALAEHVGAWVVLEPDRPFCRSEGVTLEIAAGGRGRYALEIWSSSAAEAE